MKKQVHGIWLASSLALLPCAAVWAQVPDGPLPPPGLAIQQAPKIKLQTVLINTPVTVRDAKGEMVHNLEERNFQITDNSTPQEITHFDLGGDPISLVVVVETSSRIGPTLPHLRKTGILISQTMTGPTGVGAVVGFDDEVKMLLDFTNSADDLENTISRLQEGERGSKLFDAMSTAVDMLSKRPEVSETDLGHRRVMLVISEAHDSGSEAKLGEVLRRAQLANITIYAVGISGAKGDLQKKADNTKPPNMVPDETQGMPTAPGTVRTPTTEQQDAEAGAPFAAAVVLGIWAVSHAKDKVTAHALEIAAAATGGQYVSTWKNRTMEKVLDEMGGELHSQYTLTYTPSGNVTNGYHEIHVTVDRADLKVRARPGYYLGEPIS